MLSGLLITIDILVCLTLIAVVLLQRSEGGAFGMGGGPTGLITARGAGDLLTRTTWILFALFLALSLGLTLLGAHDRATSSVIEKLKLQQANPNALIQRPTPPPAAPTPAAPPAGAPLPGAAPSSQAPAGSLFAPPPAVTSAPPVAAPLPRTAAPVRAAHPVAKPAHASAAPAAAASAPAATPPAEAAPAPSAPVDVAPPPAAPPPKLNLTPPPPKVDPNAPLPTGRP
jgi:preprotein translocase subunit SecG